ncbi:helix-turn-helix transcriptional regulator [Kineothrix sedimenti]|uniref:Helix-turn-helix transcriptional regulator n=1 Tax=Kineothrix sedimenti TaxID=3123317 RepID=A0ABZ3EQ26_9FIRM
MTIREMARSLGVSKSYYEKIEYGERSPSYNFMRKFKDEYPNANVDFIL